MNCAVLNLNDRLTIKLILVLSINFLFVSSSFADNRVWIAAAQRPPYIGEDLPENGYVLELVRTAFREMGYDIRVKYLPLVRAQLFAEKGIVDGIVPAYFQDQSPYAFSDPFPGDNIGILKRSDTELSYVIIDNSLRLGPDTNSTYVAGLLRGNIINHVVNGSPNIITETVNRPVQNIDKLEAKRIDFTLIDKYTASELIVHERPHLIGSLEYVDPPLLSNDFHIAFSKNKLDYKKLLFDFNAGLKRLYDKGEVNRILNKHGLYPQKHEAQGKVTLNIGTANNNDMLVMKELSEYYELENPNIELNWRVMDENTLRVRLMGDLAISDGKFDIMTIGAYEAPIWAESGWLVPLDSLPQNYNAEDLLPAVRSALSYEGQLYALPFYAESSMTYFRLDLFSKAGLAMPNAPSYNDIRRFARKLHDPKNNVYGICLRGKPGWGENMALLSTMVNTFGGRWFDLAWRPQLLSDEWRHAVTAYADLIMNYGPPNASKNGFAENLELFAEGKCGMWVDATVAAGMLFNPKISKVHNKLGFAPAPIARTPKGSHWLWTWALAIPHSSKNREEALKFISWATSQDYINLVGAQRGWMVAPPGTRISTYKNSFYTASSPFASFVFDAINSANPLQATAKPIPYTGIQFVGIPEFPAIGSHVGTYISKILEGETTIDQALLLSQKWTEGQMKRSGYY